MAYTVPSEYLNKGLISDQFRGIGEQLGAGPDLPAGVYGNYRVTDTGTGGRSISQRSAGEMQDEAFQRQIALARQANQPAIQAQEASKPIIEQAYGQRETSLKGRIPALKDRYENILDDLTNRETKETTETKTALGREFGKRGVPLSSGVYDQTTLEKTQPISQFYGVQRKDTGLSQESDIKTIEDLIASLPIEKAGELNKVQQMIASLESGAANTGMQNAFTSLNMQQNQNQFDAQLEQALKIAQMQNQPQAQREDRYATLGEGQTLFDLINGSPVYTNQKTYKPTAGGNDVWG